MCFFFVTIILNVFDMVCKVQFNLQYQNCYIGHLHSSLNLIHRSVSLSYHIIYRQTDNLLNSRVKTSQLRACEFQRCYHFQIFNYIQYFCTHKGTCILSYK